MPRTVNRSCLLPLIILTALGALPVAKTIHAATPVGQITVVSHVDVIPDEYKPQSEEKAAALFREEMTAAQQDKGCVSFLVLRQVDGANHFTIIETWMDSRVHAAHIASAHSISFRNRILEYLGSPFDARVHQVFK